MSEGAGTSRSRLVVSMWVPAAAAAAVAVAVAAAVPTGENPFRHWLALTGQQWHHKTPEGGRIMNDYALSKSLPLKFDDAVSKLPEALSTEGFGVLTQIDVQDVFAQKLQLPFRRYRIFGACNPKLAHRALSSTLFAGVMIPCNVIVWESDDGTATVAAVNPVQASAAQAEPAIAELAQDVLGRLERVFAKLG